METNKAAVLIQWNSSVLDASPAAAQRLVLAADRSSKQEALICGLLGRKGKGCSQLSCRKAHTHHPDPLHQAPVGPPVKHEVCLKAFKKLKLT